MPVDIHNIGFAAVAGSSGLGTGDGPTVAWIDGALDAIPCPVAGRASGWGIVHALRVTEKPELRGTGDGVDAGKDAVVKRTNTHEVRDVGAIAAAPPDEFCAGTTPDAFANIAETFIEPGLGREVGLQEIRIPLFVPVIQSVGISSRWKATFVVVDVENDSTAKLAKIGFANCGSGGLTSPTNPDNRKRSEDADDRDDSQEFDQGKGAVGSCGNYGSRSVVCWQKPGTQKTIRMSSDVFGKWGRKHEGQCNASGMR